MKTLRLLTTSVCQIIPIVGCVARGLIYFENFLKLFNKPCSGLLGPGVRVGQFFKFKLHCIRVSDNLTYTVILGN